MQKVLFDILKKLIKPTIFKTVYLSIGGYLIALSAIYTGEILNAALVFNQESFYPLVWKLLIVLVTYVILMPIANYLLINSIASNQLHLVRVMSESFFKKPYLEVSAFNRGDFSYRLEEDLYALSGHLINFVSHTISSLIIIVYIMLKLSKIGMFMSIVLMVLPLIKVITHIISLKYEKEFFTSQKKYEGQTRDYQSDMVTSRVFLENIGISHNFLKHIDSIFKDFFNKSFTKISDLRVIFTTINSYLGLFLKICILVLLSFFVSVELITVGLVITVILYFDQLSNIYETLFGSIKRFVFIKKFLIRVEELYSDSSDGEEVLDDSIISIEGVDLCMSYDASVFKNVNFKVSRGDKFAITGANGSGKSTLMKMMLGLIVPTSGSVKINEREIDNYNLQSYLDKVSCIEQSPTILGFSLSNNIKIASGETNDSKINEIISTLNLNNDMNPSTLSGGEIQRVNLARTLIRNNEVIFMDEPTNSLDKQAKSITKELLSNPNYTIVYITHDPELLELATERLDLCI